MHAMTFDYIMLFGWLASLAALWIFKMRISKEVEDHTRIFLAWFIISLIAMLFLEGKTFISTEYLANLTTEVIGIGITFFIIDRIYRYMTSRNEELYRNLALRNCKMPIYTYCASWLFIFEPDKQKLDIELNKYEDLAEFFNSDEFYYRVTRFDFNRFINVDKTYAQYYDERMNESKERFQSILVKYASKLSYQDIRLLEHFSGRAFMFTIFALMKFVSEVKWTHEEGGAPAKKVMPPNNSFKDISKDNFRKHFAHLVDLINQYNGASGNELEKWTIRNIAKLNTIKLANDNPLTEW